MEVWGLNSGKRTRLVLTTLLLVLSLSLGLTASFAEDNEAQIYVIFEDDFEDGVAKGWTISIPPEAPLGSTCVVESDDDNYVLSKKGHTWAEAGHYSWTNYTFEVRVKMLSPQGDGHVSFRMGYPSHRYFLCFSTGCLSLEKEYLGTFSTLKTAEVAFNLYSWHTIKIVCVGKNIKFYVDNVLKLDYVDRENPILSGRIGLECCSDSHIYFDDVKVSTTHRLYVDNLIKEAQDEINEAQMIDADTSEAEQRLSEAQAAFDERDLTSAESLAEKALELAKKAPVGAVSVENLLKYSAEYNRRTVEVSGTIRDIRYEEGVYRFALDDGTGVIPSTFNKTLGEIKAEDQVKVIGVFEAKTITLIAELVEKTDVSEDGLEGLYTFLIFKDDFEDGDFSDWHTSVNPEIEGSTWKVERKGDNHVLCGQGHSWSVAGDIEWTDYIFEFRFKLIKGIAQINFRMTFEPPKGTERYILRLNHGPSLAKGYLYLDEERYEDLKLIDVDIGPEIWHSVKIVCFQNNIRIYINYMLKMDYTDEDNPHLSGLIGLEPVSYNDNKPSHFLFDDIKVSKIATTTDINDLIAYAQSEIDKAREVNADVSSAELKLEQAKQAMAREEYQMVQYMVDEAVWLAKHSSLGPISIKDLRARATLCSGHVVVITGTVESLQAQYGTGYNFNLNDETGGIAVSYQGTIVDIGDGYEIRVIGAFDSTSETVAASKIEKISGPSAPTPSGPFGLTWNIELITTFITIGGAAAGVIGWVVRHERMERRRKVLFKKLMDEIDDIYSRFKMNAIQCEAELYRLKDEVLDEFKEGMIDEDKHNILEKRIEKYMKEVREQIEEES